MPNTQPWNRNERTSATVRKHRAPAATALAIPSGPTPSIVLPSPSSHKKRPSAIAGFTNRKS